MEKQLYLEAIELLRQRVEAAEDGKEFEDTLDFGELADIVHDSLDDYIELEQLEGRDPLVGLNGAIDHLGEEMIGRALAVLAAWVWLKEGRGELIKEIATELGYTPEIVWTDFEAGLNASALDDEEDEEYWDDDDPDRADEYGDEDDEKWQEADRHYEEDRLAEIGRLREDDDDDDEEEEREDYGD